MPLIKRKECKTKADSRLVNCPDCGVRRELKAMERRYMVSLLLIVVIFSLVIYLNRNIATTTSTSLGSSQPKSAGVIEDGTEKTNVADVIENETENVEAESTVKAEAEAEAEAAAQAKVEALKAKAATQRSEAEQIKLAIKQKVNRSWIRPVSSKAGLKCTIRVRLMSDGTVGTAEVVSSSGNENFDKSAVNSIYKASPLPVPNDKELFAREFRSFQFMFNPK